MVSSADFHRPIVVHCIYKELGKCILSFQKPLVQRTSSNSAQLSSTSWFHDAGSMLSMMHRSVDTTGCPVCLVLRQGAVNQLFLEVSLMFLACLDHARWAEFHLGILGPQE